MSRVLVFLLFLLPSLGRAEIWCTKQVRRWMSNANCYRDSTKSADETTVRACFPKNHKLSLCENEQLQQWLNTEFTIPGAYMGFTSDVIFSPEVKRPTIIFNATGNPLKRLLGDIAIILPMRNLCRDKKRINQFIKKVSQSYAWYINSTDPTLRSDKEMIAQGHMFSLVHDSKGPFMLYIPPLCPLPGTERSSLKDAVITSESGNIAHEVCANCASETNSADPNLERQMKQLTDIFDKLKITMSTQNQLIEQFKSQSSETREDLLHNWWQAASDEKFFPAFQYEKNSDDARLHANIFKPSTTLRYDAKAHLKWSDSVPPDDARPSSNVPTP